MLYHRGFDWGAYLANQGAAETSIFNTREQKMQGFQLLAQGLTLQTLDRGFGKLIAGQQEMNAVLLGGFAAVTSGLVAVQSRLVAMNNSIEGLRADFNWAMGKVLWNLETQNETLQSIVATLQSPLDTAAKELRRRAEDAYRNGWYDESLADFLASEQKNYQDFAVHQAIGNIYLYHKGSPDLDKAREYYIKAGKYAEPRSGYYSNPNGVVKTEPVCYHRVMFLRRFNPHTERHPDAYHHPFG